VVAAIEAGKITGHEIVDHLKAHGHLGFLSGSTPAKQLRNQRSILLVTKRSEIDMHNLGFTADDLVRVIDSDNTKVLREQTEDGQIRVEIRNGDMYIKYEIRGDQIWVFSAHLVG
jgi:hypothetical protein